MNQRIVQSQFSEPRACSVQSSISTTLLITMARDYPSYAFGHRSLSETLSDLARLHPSRIFATVPKTNALADGFQDVTFADVEHMANYLTSWICDTWGRSSTFETIAYIGVPDLRSAAVFFAVVRAGYKVSCPLTRETLANPGSSFFRHQEILRRSMQHSSSRTIVQKSFIAARSSRLSIRLAN